MGRTLRKRKKSKNGEGKLSVQINTIIKLLTWMSKWGFEQRKKVKVYSFIDTGRGLLACEKINSNEILISIPEVLLITCSVTQRSAIFKGFIENRSPKYFTEEELLTIFLAYEYLKGEDSFWWKYISTLPKNQTTLSDICQTQLTILPKEYRAEVEIEIGKIRNSFLKAGPLIRCLEENDKNLKGNFTDTIFHWSWNIVNSRCVHLNIISHSKALNNDDTIALVPFLDLLNHSPNSRVQAFFNKSTKTFDIISLTTVKKYDQVFINYGSHGNRQLLLHYGFLVRNNPDNQVPITISIKNCSFSPWIRPYELKDDLRNIGNVCHLNCVELKLEYVKENFKNCSVSYEGLSWTLKMAIWFMNAKCCVIGLRKSAQVFSSLYLAILNEKIKKDDTQYKQSVYDILYRKIKSHQDKFSKIIDANSLIIMVKQLLEEELDLMKSIQMQHEVIT